jgi:ATP-dependent RNA/DNA helicase IGHMBP2
MNAIEELKKLRKILQKERQEDYEQHKKIIYETPLLERTKSGYTWYPVKIIQKGIGYGEQIYVDLERVANLDVESQFQSGKKAALFCNYQNQEKQLRVEGVVVNISKDCLRIFLNCDDFPNWINQGKLGIDLLFDDTTYKEMDDTLKNVIDADRNRLALLREILLGKEKPFFSLLEPKFYFSHLNASQNLAVNKVLSALDVAVIHGPPGTGKTTTLIHAIKKIVESENQVLVTAPSNVAVDVLVERLAEEKLSVVRLGHPARVNENLLRLTIDSKLCNHPNFPEIKALKKRSEEFKTLALKYKRNYGKAEALQRKQLLEESKILKNEAEKLEDYTVNSIIENAQIIATTLVGANSVFLKNKMFKTVIIDEAAQALEPACWIPICKAQRVIMAGDHQQLPPTIKSKEAEKEGLAETLFEKIIKRTHASVLLDEQYRMNQDIMGFSSIKFYNGLLKAHASVANIRLGKEQPLEFWDTAGCGFEEETYLTSLFNVGEANILFVHLERLLTTYQDVQVGIICPYKAQVNYIKEKIEENEILKNHKRMLDVHTVDGFQGQERDVIYVSMVRSNKTGEIGFLADFRRMNVALTRAKKKLVIIGDSSTLGKHTFYDELISYCESKNAYFTAWELIEEY